MDIQQIDQQYVANTYRRFPITIVRGKGSLVWDDTGKEYIDLGKKTGLKDEYRILQIEREGVHVDR